MTTSTAKNSSFSHISERKRVWKTHKRRGDFDVCPDCGQGLRWLYIDGEWIPCSHEPVMFALHPDGNSTVIYKRKFCENALLYKKGDKRLDGSQVFMGYIQHYYNCPVLKKQRREWAIKNNK